MSGSIYVAISGAMIQQKRLGVISNNLANINTAGFKKDLCHFKVEESPDGLKAEIEKYNAKNELKTRLKEKLPVDNQGKKEKKSITTLPLWQQFGTTTDFSPGVFKKTGNPMDLAVSGKGLLCVQTDDGVKYTKNGQLTLNSDGILTTKNGWPVLGDGGQINIQGNEFIVDKSGEISVDGQQIDTLRVVEFENDHDLKKSGNSLFETVDSRVNGRKAASIKIDQGYIESSNVDAVKMMTQMIEVLRGYESYQKVIKTMDDITIKAINEVSKV